MWGGERERKKGEGRELADLQSLNWAWPLPQRYSIRYWIALKLPVIPRSVPAAPLVKRTYIPPLPVPLHFTPVLSLWNRLCFRFTSNLFLDPVFLFGKYDSWTHNDLSCMNIKWYNLRKWSARVFFVTTHSHSISSLARFLAHKKKKNLYFPINFQHSLYLITTTALRSFE